MADQRHYSEEEAEEILRLATRKQGSGGIPRDRLVEMAAELGLSPDQVQSAEQEFNATRNQEDERKRFESHVLRDLWSHVATYVAVNAGLVGMDLIGDGRLDWAYWPLLGWGIGVACHVASVFWSSSDAEAKAFQEWKATRETAVLTDEQRILLDEFTRNGPTGQLMAIKELRDQLGLDLKHAKDVTERYAVVNPNAFLGRRR